MPRPMFVHPTLNKGYGWKPGLPTHRFPMFSATVEAAALPSLVDLRPRCPAVYDQGQLGSCTANSWAAAIEFLILNQGLADFTPSRLFIYYNERALENDVSQDTGASISDGAHVVSTQGSPRENLWPYDIKEFAEKPPQHVYQDALKHLVYGVQQVRQDLTSMKQMLANGLPIIVGFTVYESFESQQVANTGIVPMPGYHELPIAGHAALVVGYDDSQRRFIVRHSWGTSWGLQGYFLMPYAYLTNPCFAAEFWSCSRTE
jgi:C1A family cysteine protease